MKTIPQLFMTFFIVCLSACNSCDDTGDNIGENTDNSTKNNKEGDQVGSSCGTCEVTPPGSDAIREYFGKFQMPVERNSCTTLHRPHSENRWNVFYPGRCSGCGVPNHMGVTAFENTIIVSWVASAAYEDSEDTNKRKFGHLTTFTFTENEGFKMVSDFVFEDCTHDMGEVAVSPDGSVIGALCLADRDDHEGKKTMYLMEWTGGEITQTPDSREVVSSSGGGWAGQWGLALNNDNSHYYISATTVLNGGHSGMTRFGWNRETKQKEVNGSCGGGHPTTNRIAHNKYYDTWSLFCRMDQKSINWVENSAEGLKGQTAEIGRWTDTGLADTPGGLHNGVSLGEKGWLVAATGPFDIWDGVSGRSDRTDKLSQQQIGLRLLPPAVSEFDGNEKEYPWNWIGKNAVCPPTKGQKPLAGFVQLHNFGLGGEDSDRILMGYTPTRKHTSADEFHAVEVNTKGEVLGKPVVLQRGGWGVDNLGAYMPGSGCVVFPYTWLSDDSDDSLKPGYPKFEEAVNKRGEHLKLTALCPSNNTPPAPEPTCLSIQKSELHESAVADDVSYESMCPSF